LKWLGLENNADLFLEKCKADKKRAESKIIEYIAFQKDRVRRGEISEGSVANFRKPVKLFLEMNDVSLILDPSHSFSLDFPNMRFVSSRNFLLDRAGNW